ncbi:MAG TPA: glucose-6-phosphate dehydrogenase [Candidatus Saccharimonadales bacterium]|nr:glucose-6-phosphate dehydrogenase [Candidatus Saccharimonadales bacterium]
MNNELSATTLVIFGVTGDLSRRYLLPALSEICQSSEIRAELKILGVSRREVAVLDILDDKTRSLDEQFQVMQMDYQQPQEYQELSEKLTQLGSAQTIFYFAVPPEAVLPIVNNLGAIGLNTAQHKLLMEKPFGTDMASARTLIEETGRQFKEDQIFRIDHYLAKEMAQNIAVFLGSNVLFRDVWNNRFIEKIEVAVEEQIGIEGRGKFYEQTGALRDIVQSHLLQLAALTLMEPCPDVFDMSEVRPRRLAALRQLKADPASVVKGQYDGYKEEAGVPDSAVETFAAVTLTSADPNWQGVPIRLITGKNLDKRLTEIRVYFKKSQSAQANLLRLRVQPKEGIELELWVKKPGYEQDLQKLPLDFNYQQYFDRLPDAYEQVIVDAVRGRANLFASSEEVLASWEILQPLLDRWQDYPLKIYKSGDLAETILAAQ